MFEVARPFLLSLALGLLIGIERERSHASAGGETPFGARTFTLLALLGTLAAHLREPALAAVLAAFVGALVLGVHLRGGPSAGGATTEVAAVATFALGYLAHREIVLALMLGVLAVLVLALKPRIHEFAREELAPREVDAGLTFLVIACVVLPLLPDRPLDPWQILNPFRLWLLFVLIVGIGFGGYIAVRALGVGRGLAAAGFGAGLVSSTAATLSLSQKAREDGLPLRPLAVAIVLANVASAAAQVLVVAVANPDLAAEAGLVVGAPVAVGLAGALVASGFGRKVPEEASGMIGVQNPLALKPAALFASGLAVILALASAAQRVYGEAGFFAASLLGGATDVHGVTLAAATLEGAGTIGADQALVGIVVAFVVNMLVKLSVAGWAGGRRLFFAVAPPLVAMLAAAIAALAAVRG